MVLEIGLISLDRAMLGNASRRRGSICRSRPSRRRAPSAILKIHRRSDNKHVVNGLLGVRIVTPVYAPGRRTRRPCGRVPRPFAAPSSSTRTNGKTAPEVDPHLMHSRRTLVGPANILPAATNARTKPVDRGPPSRRLAEVPHAEQSHLRSRPRVPSSTSEGSEGSYENVLVDANRRAECCVSLAKERSARRDRPAAKSYRFLLYIYFYTRILIPVRTR